MLTSSAPPPPAAASAAATSAAHSVIVMLPVEGACVVALPPALVLAFVLVNEATSNERVLPNESGGCRGDRNSAEEGEGEAPRLLDGEGRCRPENSDDDDDDDDDDDGDARGGWEDDEDEDDGEAARNSRCARDDSWPSESMSGISSNASSLPSCVSPSTSVSAP